jgi:bacillolysin
MKNFTSLLILALFSFCFTTIAQQKDTLKIVRNDKGIITFVSFAPRTERTMANGETFLKEVLKLEQKEDFRLQKENTDKYGIIHQRYQQYYNGIKVEGAEYLVHGKNRIIETINGNYRKVGIISTSQQLAEQQALEKAIVYVDAEIYKWEDKGMELFIKKNTGNSDATYYPKGELIIVKDAMKDKGNFKLAWKFTISSLSPNNEQLIYIDASTGDVIGEVSLLLDVNTPGTAGTLYSGTKNITCDSYTSGFRLRENKNGVDILTMNLSHTTNLSNAIDFNNSNANWTNGSWAGFAQDRQALDAHWGAEQVFNYWKGVHGRNSIDNSGIKIASYVHYGNNIDNAYWDTTSHVMYYGDGNMLNPLVALDICAHEFGHGVNQFSANLTPGTLDSGALNEGFSDIWGAVIENWSAPEKVMWLMGEELFGVGSFFNCIRNIQNPKSTMTFEGQHPDTYQGDFWRTDGEPHNNSTVLSYWFYLLSNGSSATDGINDNNDTFSINGIGVASAAAIVYQAQTNYLTSSSGYTDARTAMISAAEDIFGSNSCQVKTVTDAWHAVGVGDIYKGNSTISGSNVVCSSEGAYTVINLPSGATITWSSSSNISINSSQGSNPCTFSAFGSGQGWIKATLNNGCGSEIVIQKDVWVGSPVFSITRGITESETCDTKYHYVPFIINLPPDTNLKFNFLSPKVACSQNGNIYTFQFLKNYSGTFSIIATATNSCGSYMLDNEGEHFINNCSSIGLANSNSITSNDTSFYKIYPNPSTDVVNISLVDESQKPVTTSKIIAELYDFTGQSKQKVEVKHNTASINVAGLKKGIYILNIIIDGNTEGHQVIIE